MPRRLLTASTLLLSLLATVVSVDLSPRAYEMLMARAEGSNEAWITDVYYTWAGGQNFALVEGGSPQALEDYLTVQVNDLKVRVLKATVFSGDIPRIVDFPRRNGQRDIGVGNVVF